MTDEEQALYQEAAKEVLRSQTARAADWLSPEQYDPCKNPQVVATHRLATSLDRLSDTLAGVLDALSDWAKSK